MGQQLKLKSLADSPPLVSGCAVVRKRIIDQPALPPLPTRPRRDTTVASSKATQSWLLQRSGGLPLDDRQRPSPTRALVPKRITVVPHTEESFVKFAVMLESRHSAYLEGAPIAAELRFQQLCNADRRCDRTSLHVITNILAKKNGADMLFHLALMRCGPNHPERCAQCPFMICFSYPLLGCTRLAPCSIRPHLISLGSVFVTDDKLIAIIDGKFTLSSLTEAFESYETSFEKPWGPYSYRGQLMCQRSNACRAKIVYQLKNSSVRIWNTIRNCVDWSAAVYDVITSWTSEMCGWQLCLDLGYKHPEIYDEDKHEYIGGLSGQGAMGGLQLVYPTLKSRDGRTEFNKMRKLRDKLKPVMKMTVTNQTVEGLLCEYRKWLRNTAGGTVNRRSNRHSGNLEEYKTKYAVAVQALAKWKQQTYA